jgi:prepilin-type N-terminal cleavage/methylation domain-containing protein
MRSPSSDSGFSLVETMIALGVLTVGVLGAAGILATGMKTLGSSPGDIVVMQKATEAIEAVFSARDSHRLTWAQLQNVFGASGTDGGIFTDGAQPLTLAGPDGLVGTTDDLATVESVILPGHDQLLGTADDVTNVLTQYTRTITIRNVLNDPVGCSAGPSAAPCQLRSVTVTITYQNATMPVPLKYVLTTFISAYS